MKRDYYLS